MKKAQILLRKPDPVVFMTREELQEIIGKSHQTLWKILKEDGAPQAYVWGGPNKYYIRDVVYAWIQARYSDI